MNFKDRGNKKWTAMMLIEHRQKMKELKESEQDRKKPILDEQEKVAINSKLRQALQNDLEVEINYYDNKRFKTAAGRIYKVDINQRYIIISNKKILFKNILELKLE